METGRATFLIGIDEVGRGPLAGPVVVAGVKIRKAHHVNFYKSLKDSKKLTPRQRERWFEILACDPRISWHVSAVGPAVIDQIRIGAAIHRAALRIYRKLAGREYPFVLLDGGLFLPKHIRQKTIIRGDEKIPLIAAASIIGKVIRDRTMLRLHVQYPRYRFDLHKGYGTQLHRERLQIYGPSPVHRVSFLRNVEIPAYARQTNDK